MQSSMVFRWGLLWLYLKCPVYVKPLLHVSELTSLQPVPIDSAIWVCLTWWYLGNMGAKQHSSSVSYRVMVPRWSTFPG